MTRGRYAALAGNQDQYDLDIPLPLMMVQDEGDVPLNPVTKEQVVVPVTKSSTPVPENTEVEAEDIADKKENTAKKQQARTGKDRPLAQEALEPKRLLSQVHALLRSIERGNKGPRRRTTEGAQGEQKK